MKVNEKCKFAKVYSKFKAQSHTMKDVSDLVTLIRDNKSLSLAAKKCLISIPLQVLENQATLIREDEWKTQGYYFRGNMVGNDSFCEKYRERFENNLDWIDMINLLKEIILDEQKLNSNFYLRNIEVTLRDFSGVKNDSNFQESGLVFAKIMEDAFLL